MFYPQAASGCYTRRMWWQIRIPRSALWLYGGSLAAGFLNYLFNVVMARDAWLGPQEFGVLAAIGSLLYLEGVMVSAVTTASAAYVAGFVARGEEGNIVPFLRRFSWYVGLVGLAAGMLLVLTLPALAGWLHLNEWGPLWLLAATWPLALLAGITIGALQGAVIFDVLAVVLVVGAGLRLLLAMPLVGVLEWGVSGAMAAGLAGVAAGYVVSWWPLKRYQPARPASQAVVSFSLRELLAYTHGVFWAMVGLTSLFSVDLLLARHYLPASEAGLYGGLSTLGRIVYFLTLPFTMVMFPAAAARVAAGRPLRRTLLLTGGGMLLVGVGVVGAYALMPGVIIAHTVGGGYLAGAKVLWLFGVFFGLVTVATWLVHVLLARRLAGVAMLPPLALGLQLLLVSFWHDSSIHVLLASTSAAAVLVMALGLRALYGLWYTTKR